MAATPLDELGHSAIAQKGWLRAHKWLLARRFSQLLYSRAVFAGAAGRFLVVEGQSVKQSAAGHRALA